MGSIIPAAWTGGMTKESRGTANKASPPKPPLDMPVIKTAGIATR